MPNDRGSSCWFRRRLLYYLCLTAIVAPFALYFGPNLFSFAQLTRPTPADFVSEAQANVRAVQAMKAYRQQYGRLPEPWDLDVTQFSELRYRGMIIDGEFVCVGPLHHLIRYRFTPGQVGWRIEGAYINGPIPLPPVPDPPATQATTRKE